MRRFCIRYLRTSEAFPQKRAETQKRRQSRAFALSPGRSSGRVRSFGFRRTMLVPPGATRARLSKNMHALWGWGKGCWLLAAGAGYWRLVRGFCFAIVDSEIKRAWHKATHGQIASWRKASATARGIARCPGRIVFECQWNHAAYRCPSVWSNYQSESACG